MSAAVILDRLELVRQRGAGQWSARCPAHEDKSPSLSIKELADDRVLLHCFGGCGAADVIRAVGLEMDALFPPRTAAGAGHQAASRRRLLTAGQALEMLDVEMQFGAVTIASAASGAQLTDEDIDRLLQSAARISYLRDEVLA